LANRRGGDNHFVVKLYSFRTEFRFLFIFVADSFLLKTAVVILNWNGKKWLEKFLPSVHASLPEDASLIVADNASTDDSVSFLEKTYPSIRIVQLQENFGFAGGYNMALEQIEAEYFVLLNSDVETRSGWLEPLVLFMDGHPDYAACQPKIQWYGHEPSFEYAGASGGYIDINGYPFCRGRIFSTLETDSGQYNDIVDVLWATGACLMIRRSDFCNSGGLDTSFFAHMEEIDLCWRLWNMGRKVAVVPQSVVFHVGGGSLPRSSARKTYLNFRNNLLLLHKNYPPKMVKKVLRRRFWLDTIAMFLFFVQGHFKDGVAVLKARRDFKRMRKDYKIETDFEFPTTIFKGNVLKQYYLKRNKMFSDLK